MQWLSGHVTYLEVQEGKNVFEDLGTTSACVARASKFCSDMEKVEVTLQHDVKSKKIWIGNSWFGSIQTVAHVAKNSKYSIMMVNTAHSSSSKNVLEHEMKYIPGGCWIVLEEKAKKEEVDLLSIGYKYIR